MSAEVLTEMAAAARLAPSIHNSQPWRFEAGQDRLEVHADRTRATPVVDPLGRWVHVACGAAALNAAVVAGALGRRRTVRLLPDRSRPDLMAVVELGSAELIAEHSAEDVALATAIPLRHTVRTRFDPEPVPLALVDRMRAAVEREGAWMQVVDNRADVVELTVLTERAEAEEAADERYRDELRAWLRSTEGPAEDGIGAGAFPTDGSYGVGSPVPLRDFRGEGPATTSSGPPAEVERPLLVIVGTDGDHHLDWVRAGMAMQRLWLTATAAGLAASPISQALDHAGPRALVGRLVGHYSGHPQMLLRMGYGVPVALTGRRALADLMGEQ